MLECDPNCAKTQKMFEKAVFMLQYCPGKYKFSEKKGKKAVDVCLPLLKFAPDWIFTNRIFNRLDDAVYFNIDIVFFNADYDSDTFIAPVVINIYNTSHGTRRHGKVVPVA